MYRELRSIWYLGWKYTESYKVSVIKENNNKTINKAKKVKPGNKAKKVKPGNKAKKVKSGNKCKKNNLK